MPYKFSVRSLTFNDGTKFSPNKITVLVGPNNAGKSRALRDIMRLLTTADHRTVVVADVDYAKPSSLNDMFEAYSVSPHRDTNGNFMIRTLGPDLQGTFTAHLGGADRNWQEIWDRQFKSPPSNFETRFAQHFGGIFVASLTTDARLSVTKETDSEVDSQGTSQLLQALYNAGRSMEDKVSAIVKAAFGREIKLDFSTLRKICVRISESFQNFPTDPRDQRELMKAFDKLDDQGDGIKSYVATVLSLLVGQRPLVLIDEPEAFLHPPQALRLGEFVAEQAEDDKQIFVATHSTDFLRGLLTRAQDVQVIRIERTENRNTFRALNGAEVNTIANDPLLGSSRVLTGMFYPGVVIVEADSDGAFYHRVSRQIRSSDDYYFVHAHNKQTVPKVAKPYKSVGVKCATLTDFDTLRERPDLEKILDSMDVSAADRIAILSLRDKIATQADSNLATRRLSDIFAELSAITSRNSLAFHEVVAEGEIAHIRRELKRIRETGAAWARLKQNGRNALSDENKIVFDELDQLCRGNGIFICTGGELESWMEQYGVLKTKNKGRWIVSALTRLTELEPDVRVEPWRFVSDVHRYLAGPSR